MKTTQGLRTAMMLMALWLPHVAVAGDRKYSDKQACNDLCVLARQRHLSAAETSTGYYDCSPDRGSGRYIVLGLHYRDANDTHVGSNLVGWYAVDEITGRFYEWDVATFKVGGPI